MPNIILKNDDKIITIQHTSAPYIVKSNDYNDLLNKPDLSVYATKIYVDDELAGKAEKVHVHTISSVTGLQSALNGKANSVHTHLIQDVTNLQAELDSKADTTHNHDGRYYTEAETDAKLALKANASDLTAHTSNTSNPHSVTKAQVGLGNAENTSDANKPVSTATQTALDAKESLSNKDTSVLLGSSDVKYPSQKAVKTYVDTADAAHVAAADPHTQYMNSDRGDARYAGQPYAVMAKSQFASLSSSYGILGRIFGNDGYKNDLQVYGLSTQAGTPTPDVPVPIVSTTGDVTVRSDNKNLLSISAPASTTTNGITRTYNADGSITLNGTVGGTEGLSVPLVTPLTLTGVVTHSIGATVPSSVWISLNNNSTTMISPSQSSKTWTADSTTFTSYYIYMASGVVFSNFTIRPQIESGSTATAFEKNMRTTQTLPLGTTRLRSLPNGVSDRIYKDGSTWKLEQNVGQTVLNGTGLTWANDTTTVSTDYAYFYTSNLDNTISNAAHPNVISDKLKGESFGLLSSSVIATDSISGSASTDRIRIYILKTRLSAVTVAAFNTYLASNNITVNYGLTTPITTTITDPTLITALENIRTYQGVTNITASTPVSGSYGLDLTTSLANKANVADTVTLTGTQTVTNKTLTNPVINNARPTANVGSDVGTSALYYNNLFARRHYFNSTAYIDGATAGRMQATGLFMPVQATTAGAPAYVKGAIYFDTTLNKLRIGGATGWGDYATSAELTSGLATKGQVNSVLAGANVSVDNTDPANPVVSSTASGVSDHGALTGLADDDHTQYHNDTRGDARYLKLAGGALTGGLTGTTAAFTGNVTTTANAGVGVSSPLANLHINGSGPTLLVKDSSTSTVTGNARLRLAESGAGGSLDNYWDIRADGAIDSNFGFAIGNNNVTNVLYLQRSTGFMGIGTTSTPSRLTVNGDTEMLGSTSGVILASPDGTRYRVTVANGGTLTITAA